MTSSESSAKGYQDEHLSQIVSRLKRIRIV